MSKRKPPVKHLGVVEEKRLPKDLKDIWDIALEDLKKCRRSNKFAIEMGEWHNAFDGEKCYVCMAGAVMSKSLNGNINEFLVPTDFSIWNHVRLFAIDDLRTGHVQNAADRIGKDCFVMNVDMPEFDENDPKPFYKAAKQMSELLHQLDL